MSIEHTEQTEQTVSAVAAKEFHQMGCLCLLMKI